MPGKSLQFHPRSRSGHSELPGHCIAPPESKGNGLESWRYPLRGSSIIFDAEFGEFLVLVCVEAGECKVL